MHRRDGIDRYASRHSTPGGRNQNGEAQDSRHREGQAEAAWAQPLEKPWQRFTWDGNRRGHGQEGQAKAKCRRVKQTQKGEGQKPPGATSYAQVRCDDDGKWQNVYQDSPHSTTLQGLPTCVEGILSTGRSDWQPSAVKRPHTWQWQPRAFAAWIRMRRS